MNQHLEDGVTSTLSKTEQIRQDRWFKLKWDRFISGLTSNAGMYYADKMRQSNHKKWYELNYEWEQIAETLAKDSKYSVEDVKAFMEEQYHAAKLEAILESN